MATVERAWDAKLERWVAIKQPHEHLAADRSFRVRFLSEARKLARVRNPYVVEIYDIDEAHDPPRMIMELADGGSLRDRSLAGPTDVGVVIEVLRQLLRGLTAIHDADLIHRDLKPENILAFDEVYKIADFGIAKLASEQTQRYVTPKYGAPEIQRGAGASTRADLYALGLIVYELMVGAERFIDLAVESFLAVGNTWEEPPDGDAGPRDRRFPWSVWHLDSRVSLPALSDVAGASPALAAIIAQMIAKHPDARYASGRSVLVDLDGSLVGTRTERVEEPVGAPIHQEAPHRETAGSDPPWHDRVPATPAWDAAAPTRTPVDSRAGEGAGPNRTPPNRTPPSGAPPVAGTRRPPAPRITPRLAVLLGGIFAAIMAGGGLAAFVAMTDEPSAERPLEPLRREALETADRGDHQAAVLLIDRALELRIDDPQLLRAGVRSHYQLANYGRAVDLLDRLESQTPPGGDAWVDYYRGLIALTRSPTRADQALPFLERAAGRAGVPADSLFYLGFAYLKSGDHSGAAGAYERFLETGEGTASNIERAERFLRARRRPASPKADLGSHATVSAGAAERVSAYRRPLVLRGFERRDLSLSSLRGEVVVVHLWATWCKPCKVELPNLVTFYRREYPALAARGLRLITISNDFAVGDLSSFLRRELAPGTPQGFPIYWDPDSELNNHLGLGTALPQTVILDRQGRRLRQVTGTIDWSSPRLHEQLAAYL